MAEEIYRTARPDFMSHTRWGAIFAGTFAALAVWATFGMLGLAIFGSTASANANRPLTGMTWGEGAWIIVLSVISLYVGGRVTSALVDAENRGDAIIHGFVMFGLSSFTAVLITTMIAGTSPYLSAVPTGNVHNPNLLYDISTGGWIIFISLVLSMGAAIWGSLHNAPPKGGQRSESQSPDIRRVA